MDKLEGLRAFVKVVELGSFSDAGRAQKPRIGVLDSPPYPFSPTAAPYPVTIVLSPTR